MPPTSPLLRRHRPHRRRAFTLLEIVLGMAIFFGSLAIFSQILWNGSRAAVQSQLRSQALVRCEAKLGEVVAGALPFQSQANQTFSSEPADVGWTWSVEIQPTNHPNLNNVVVEVEHVGNSGLSQAAVRLHRWMRDPAQLALVAMEAAKQDELNKQKAEEAKAEAERQKEEAKTNGSDSTKKPSRRGVGPNDDGRPKGDGNPKDGGNPKNGPNPKDGPNPKGNPGGEGNPKGGGPPNGGNGGWPSSPPAGYPPDLPWPPPFPFPSGAGPFPGPTPKGR
ncbi:MAG TPA: hypothetical protein VFG20_15750 [Planctomycetaceae bacterium]|nr:hypothetical protein [Planctomycetaceae bacterium]